MSLGRRPVIPELVPSQTARVFAMPYLGGIDDLFQNWDHLRHLSKTSTDDDGGSVIGSSLMIH